MSQVVQSSNNSLSQSPAVNLSLIKKLILKDWQLFEKQLAGYVLGGILSLCLMGHGKLWSFYLGSLLLIIVIVAVACFAISTSLVNERKEHTLPFVMSLPISPLDFYLAKLVGNLITFGVPMLLLAIATLATIWFTALPDGLIVFALLIFAHVTLAFCISLSVALAVESEGWNIFAMIASMVMVNPFIMLIGQISAISKPVSTNAIVWSWQALSILSLQAFLSVLILCLTGLYHCRKRAFY